MGMHTRMAANVLIFGLAAAALLALAGCGGGGGAGSVSRDRVSIVPPGTVSHRITACSGSPSGAFISVQIRGEVTAHRSVSSVTIRGYVRVGGGGEREIGTKTLGSMLAGQTKAFQIIRPVPGSSGTVRCRVDAWAG